MNGAWWIDEGYWVRTPMAVKVMRQMTKDGFSSDNFGV